MILDKNINASIEDYFSRTFEEFGATARGADWRDHAAQELRFQQLVKILHKGVLRFPSGIAEKTATPKVVDFGCGYGAFLDFLDTQSYSVDYLGLDITKSMVSAASARHTNRNNCRFKQASKLDEDTDFTICSGTFNMLPAGLSSKSWQEYILQSLENINSYSTTGFAFNLLTTYNDPEKVKPHLFYGDPLFFFDHCKRNFSKNIALLHDYGAYEFTVLVRKEI